MPYEQLYVVILVEGGKLEKNQSFQKIEFVHGEEEIFFNFFLNNFLAKNRTTNNKTARVSVPSPECSNGHLTARR